MGLFHSRKSLVLGMCISCVDYGIKYLTEGVLAGLSRAHNLQPNYADSPQKLIHQRLFKSLNGFHVLHFQPETLVRKLLPLAALLKAY